MGIGSLTKPWYLFSELRWEVENLEGAQAGELATFLTVEHLALDPAGHIYARSGYASHALGWSPAD